MGLPSPPPQVVRDECHTQLHKSTWPAGFAVRCLWGSLSLDSHRSQGNLCSYTLALRDLETLGRERKDHANREPWSSAVLGKGHQETRTCGKGGGPRAPGWPRSFIRKRLHRGQGGSPRPQTLSLRRAGTRGFDASELLPVPMSEREVMRSPGRGRPPQRTPPLVSLERLRPARPHAPAHSRPRRPPAAQKPSRCAHRSLKGPIRRARSGQGGRGQPATGHAPGAASLSLHPVARGGAGPSEDA